MAREQRSRYALDRSTAAPVTAPSPIRPRGASTASGHPTAPRSSTRSGLSADGDLAEKDSSSGGLHRPRRAGESPTTSTATPTGRPTSRPTCDAKSGRRRRQRLRLDLPLLHRSRLRLRQRAADPGPARRQQHGDRQRSEKRDARLLATTARSSTRRTRTSKAPTLHLHGRRRRVHLAAGDGDDPGRRPAHRRRRRDTTAPTISGLKVSLKIWRLGKGLARSRKPPVGTTISFKLSEAAAATLSFQRFVPAKKGGKPRYVNAGGLKALAGEGRAEQGALPGPPDPDAQPRAGQIPGRRRARDAAGNQRRKRNGTDLHDRQRIAAKPKGLGHAEAEDTTDDRGAERARRRC